MFHVMFEAQARARPQAVALRAQGRAFTYAALDEASTALALRLQALGASPDQHVGILLERTPDVAIALLAVLKAGAAFVVLDPSWPLDRLHRMAEVAKLTTVITRRVSAPSLPHFTGPFVLLDEPVAAEGKAVASRAGPASRAYSMFTSGSTAEPRLVSITHGQMQAFLDRWVPALGIRSDDVCLHAASFSFSASIRQLFGPWMAGATVVLAGKEPLANTRALFDLILREDVTVLQVVPSLLRTSVQVLSRMDPARRKSLLANKLRRVLCASEPLWSDLPFAWAALHPAQIVNMFGHTETAGVSLYWPVDLQQLEGPARIVPLGKPLPGIDATVRLEDGAPAAPGQLGELWISGPTVGQGYFGSESSPFLRDSSTGDGTFRTGDLVRQRADGSLEFVGRTDHQVKVRGVRIDLAEIESVLRRHPQIWDVAVVSRTQGEDTVLHAYAVLRTTEPPTPAPDLKRFLQEQLPPAYVPATVQVLDAFPRTVNGKLDRTALPDPTASAGSADRYVAPRSPLEELLTGLWEELLKVEKVGVRDDFFELGGHSLLATRLLGAIEEIMPSKALLLADFFQSPTIESLARSMKATQDETVILQQLTALASPSSA